MARIKKTSGDIDSTLDTETTAVRKSPRKRKPRMQHDDPPEDKSSLSAKPAKATHKKTKKAILDDTIPDLSMNQGAVGRVPSGNTHVAKKATADVATKVITEADIMAAQTPAQMALLVNTLISTQQDQIFSDYKQNAQLQQLSDSKLISTLRQQLETKQNTIDTLAAQLLELQGRQQPLLHSNSTPQRGKVQDMYELPIRKHPSLSSMIHRDDMDHELKTISFTFDMLELLTGVRIVNYEEDSEKFYFDVKHSSTVLEPEVDAVCIEYRLVIERQFESTAEVTYVPGFLNDLSKKARDAEQELKNRDARKLVPFLPEYLQDNLKFPYSTLLQFYTKLSKALNRSAKS